MAAPLVELAGPAELATVVTRLAAELDAAHPEGFVAVGVLKGSVPFMADLLRRVTVPVEVDFLAITPYASGEGRVRLVKDLDLDVAGRHVVVVEDIVDTGLTLAYLRRQLAARGTASLATCTLVDKPVRRIVPVPVEHRGLEVGDVFVLGYGLDWAGRYRNLNGLWGGDAAALAVEPDIYLLDLYGRSPARPGPGTDSS
jgi:hypoxanthine phosphoribosyltransferase